MGSEGILGFLTGISATERPCLCVLLLSLRDKRLKIDSHQIPFSVTRVSSWTKLLMGFKWALYWALHLRRLCSIIRLPNLGESIGFDIRFMSHVRPFSQNLESLVIGLAQFHVDPTLSKLIPIQNNYSYFVIGATWLGM